MHVSPWCTGKTAYPTKAKAITRIERQHKDRRRRKDKFCCTLQPYLCPTCHQWHVGGTGRAANAVDSFGRTIRKKHNMLPKERPNGNPE